MIARAYDSRFTEQAPQSDWDFTGDVTVDPFIALSPNFHYEVTEQQPVGWVPYMTMRAFYDTPAFAASLTKAGQDRRLLRADMTLSPGGLPEAVNFFASHPTPDLLVIETAARGNTLFDQLEALAAVCDGNTKVVLIGTVNDIPFYLQMLDRGIADYLVGPVSPLTLITVTLKLFPQEVAARSGKVLAFIGAKGGAGSSTVAQNTAWSLAQTGEKVLLADLDLQFGTAALNFNVDAPVGFVDHVAGSERLDDALLERILLKRGPHLSILAGATAAGPVAPPALELLDRVLDRVRATFPFVILDLPHEWTPWVRRALLAADQVIVTAEPDLASLRNARMLFDLLKTDRPNDPSPQIVLNRTGMPKRAEMTIDQFAATLETSVKAQFRFAPALYSRAANAGQMIAELSGSSGRPFLQLAQDLAGKAPANKARKFFRWRPLG
jgi:pilus assembly protein CpaE